jgi:hypothetical protein
LADTIGDLDFHPALRFAASQHEFVRVENA